MSEFLWILFGGMAVIGFIGALFAPSPDPEPSLPNTFGSAEWARWENLRAAGLLDGDGLILGLVACQHGFETLRYGGDKHLMTIAHNRSGKGTCSIIPNLLTYQGSVLVIDPKGENAMITANARERMGQRVHVVDPWGITGLKAARFNPLDWLEIGSRDIGENAALLADALIVPDAKGESFWADEAKSLLHGLILYVATDERETGQRHLARVRDLMMVGGDDMLELFHRMLESEHHIVRSTGARSLQKDEKLLSSVVASAQAQTAFLDSDYLRENLSASDFRFEDLKERPTTIYLVLPADRLIPFGRWLRLLIQQAITVNARNIERRPAKPILFLLDEMPALGKLTMIEQAYGLMAGFGIQLWGIAQDISQLKRIYGESWETFVANAGVTQYYGGRDKVTADYFSALCGDATVWNFSSSTSVSTTYTKEGRSTTSGTTFNRAVAHRKLAYPDELMRLHKSTQLVLIDSQQPIFAGRVPWFENPALKALGRNLHAVKTIDHNRFTWAGGRVVDVTAASFKLFDAASRGADLSSETIS